MKRQLSYSLVLLLTIASQSLLADEKTPPKDTSSVPTAAAQSLIKAASETDDKDMKMMMMMMAMQQMQQASANKKADQQNSKADKARKDDEKDAKGEQKIAMPSPLPSPQYNTEKPTEQLDMVETTLKRDDAERAAREKDIAISTSPLPLIAPNVVSGEFDVNALVPKVSPTAETTEKKAAESSSVPNAIEKPATADLNQSQVVNLATGQPHPGGAPTVMSQIAKPISVNDLGTISKGIEEVASEGMRKSKSTKDEPAEGSGGGSEEKSSSGGSAIEDFFAALNGELESSPSIPLEEGAVEGEKKSDKGLPNIFQVAQGMYHYAAYMQKRVNLKPEVKPTQAEASAESKKTAVASNH